MPPVSKAQGRFLWSQKPKVAKKWAAEGEMSTKGLPERVTPKGKSPQKIRVKIP